jgi:hypothetical protein
MNPNSDNKNKNDSYSIDIGNSTSGIKVVVSSLDKIVTRKRKGVSITTAKISNEAISKETDQASILIIANEAGAVSPLTSKLSNTGFWNISKDPSSNK